MATEAEIAVFYSLELVNSYLLDILKDPQWGTFIENDSELVNYSDPNQKYQFPINQKSKTDFSQIVTEDNELKHLISEILKQKATLSTSDQCSTKYYLDLYDLLKLHTNEIQRIVEVGPHLGDLSIFFSSCIHSMNITFDLVDVDAKRLRYSYERIRRAFPEAANKVRLFFGDLPTYVNHELKFSNQKSLIHYKGSCSFNDVIRDIGSLSYVKEKIFSLIIHNTNLRSTNISDFAFVDVALFALFGHDIKHLQLGEVLQEDVVLKNNNDEVKHYYLANHFEGLYIPFSHNEFHFPHSNECLDNFLYKK